MAKKGQEMCWKRHGICCLSSIQHTSLTAPQVCGRFTSNDLDKFNPGCFKANFGVKSTKIHNIRVVYYFRAFMWDDWEERLACDNFLSWIRWILQQLVHYDKDAQAMDSYKIHGGAQDEVPQHSQVVSRWSTNPKFCRRIRCSSASSQIAVGDNSKCTISKNRQLRAGSDYGQTSRGEAFGTMKM